MGSMSKFRGVAASFAGRVGAFVKTAALALVGAVGLGVATVQDAYAQTATLASTATSKLTSAESDITGILILLVGVVFLFVLYSLIKKAK